MNLLTKIDGVDYKGKKYQIAKPKDWQLKRYSNKKFGKLFVKYPVWVEGLVTQPDSTAAIWLTTCDCGNDYCISMQRIRKELNQGLIPDCGCGARQEQDKKYIGKTYNYLTVIARDDDYKNKNHFSNKNTYYRCRCICGKETIVRINTLVAGEVKSCGCLKETQNKINLIPNKMIDLTGQKFGYLTALTPFKNPDDPKNETWWHCQCDCGKIYDVRSVSLRNGDTTSCGCKKISHGEEQIKTILIENQINFLHNIPYFKDLILPGGVIGRYDFILFNDDGPYRLIEYDGEQHFRSVDFFGGEAGFKARQENDKIKDLYAKQHDLPLVRIPYTQTEITFELLMSDTFLIK